MADSVNAALLGAPIADAATAAPASRPRSSSIKETLQYMANPPEGHHLSQSAFSPNPGGRASGAVSPVPGEGGVAVEQKGKRRRKLFVPTDDFTSRGLWNDLYTMRWMRIPESSLKIILFTITVWLVLELSLPLSIPNPLSHALFISYPLPPESALLPGSSTSSLRSPLLESITNFSLRRFLRPNSSHPAPLQPVTHYGKGWLDVAFLAFYVIVFSFVRQALTEWCIRPMARWYGFRGEGKIYRVMEQGYAFVYFTVTGVLGLIVMAQQDTWFYRTEHFWRGYPHWKLDAYTKYYYLLQYSYWLQQALVMILKIEKPRPDYVELIIHHLVTLWLINWSYISNLTVIGVAVFVSMDVPDAFLALSKTVNYLRYEQVANILFLFFLGAWTYFRHWLNFKILYSVWVELPRETPKWAQIFYPTKGIWLVWWMKYQIFAPILLLQFVNLFWYYLIMRILYKIIRGQNAEDVREVEEEAEDRRLIEQEKREKAERSERKAQ